MTWVYAPSVCLAEQVDLTSRPSGAGSKPSATSNGTATPRASSCPECATGDWTSPHFGTMLPPSTAQLGVERWISSLGGSPVSLIQSPESEKGQTTSATFGPIRCEYCESPEPGDSSERMSQGSLPMDLPHRSWQTLNERVSAGLPFQIRLAPMVPHICVSECSLLPTPREFASRDSIVDRGKSNLGEVVGGITGEKLHPAFTDWLMGWRIGWSELDELATAWFQTKPSPPLKS